MPILKKRAASKDITLAEQDEATQRSAATSMVSSLEVGLCLDSATKDVCRRLKCIPIDVCLEAAMRVEVLSLDQKITLKTARDHYVQLLRVMYSQDGDEDNFTGERFVLVYTRLKQTFRSKAVPSVLDQHERCEIHAGHVQGRTFSIKASREVVTFHTTSSEDMLSWVAELMAVRDWNNSEESKSPHYHVQRVHTEAMDVCDTLMTIDRTTLGKEEMAFANPITGHLLLTVPVTSVGLITCAPSQGMLWLDLEDECARGSRVCVRCPGHWCSDICDAVRAEMKQILGDDLCSVPAPDLGYRGMKYYPKVVPDYTQIKAKAAKAEADAERDDMVGYELPIVESFSVTDHVAVVTPASESRSQSAEAQSESEQGTAMSGTSCPDGSCSSLSAPQQQQVPMSEECYDSVSAADLALRRAALELRDPALRRQNAITDSMIGLRASQMSDVFAEAQDEKEQSSEIEDDNYDTGAERPAWTTRLSFYHATQRLVEMGPYPTDNTTVRYTPTDNTSAMSQPVCQRLNYQIAPTPKPKVAAPPHSDKAGRKRLTSCSPADSPGTPAGDQVLTTRSRSQSVSSLQAWQNRGARICMDMEPDGGGDAVEPLDDGRTDNPDVRLSHSFPQDNCSQSQLEDLWFAYNPLSGDECQSPTDAGSDSARSPQQTMPVIVVHGLDEGTMDGDASDDLMTQHKTLRSHSTSELCRAGIDHDLEALGDYDTPSVRPQFSPGLRSPSPATASRQRSWSRNNVFSRSRSFSESRGHRTNGYKAIKPGIADAVNKKAQESTGKTEEAKRDKKADDDGNAQAGLLGTSKPKKPALSKSFLKRLRKLKARAASADGAATAPLPDAGQKLFPPKTLALSTARSVDSPLPKSPGEGDDQCRNPASPTRRPLPRTPSEHKLHVPTPPTATPAVEHTASTPAVSPAGTPAAGLLRHAPGRDDQSQGADYEDITLPRQAPAPAKKTNSYEDIELKLRMSSEQALKQRSQTSTPTIVALLPPRANSSMSKQSDGLGVGASPLPIPRRVVTPDVSKKYGRTQGRLASKQTSPTTAQQTSPIAAQTPPEVQAHNNINKEPAEMVTVTSDLADTHPAQQGTYSHPKSKRCANDPCPCAITENNQQLEPNQADNKANNTLKSAPNSCTTSPVTPGNTLTYEYNIPRLPVRFHSFPDGDRPNVDAEFQADLQACSHRLSSPDHDPCYERYLTPSEWAQQEVGGGGGGGRSASFHRSMDLSLSQHRHSAHRSAPDIIVHPGPEGVVH